MVCNAFLLCACVWLKNVQSVFQKMHIPFCDLYATDKRIDITIFLLGNAF